MIGARKRLFSKPAPEGWVPAYMETVWLHPKYSYKYCRGVVRAVFTDIVKVRVQIAGKERDIKILLSEVRPF